MVSGEWSGTMCLTEAHCGTDLGLLRTKAEPQGDGSYKITGSKIFISAGDHDLTDNVIHLVLARHADAPKGVKGISLFLVPKFLPKDDGTRSAPRNGVSVAGIEHKMGLKASATCQINFDDATGWLVGEPNKGMAAMFTMMNTERVSVGVQGLGINEIAYQSAVAYAKERLQGRVAVGHQAPRSRRRSDHRPSRRAPHADDDARLCRGLPRARAVVRACARCREAFGRSRGEAARRRLRRADDAGGEGDVHRLSASTRPISPSRPMAAMAISASTASSSSPAMRGSR